MEYIGFRCSSLNCTMMYVTSKTPGKKRNIGAENGEEGDPTGKNTRLEQVIYNLDFEAVYVHVSKPRNIVRHILKDPCIPT